MTDCLFCKIINKDIQSKIVFEDDQVLAFEDIHPQAPLHLLIIPKTHITTLNDLDKHHVRLMGTLTLAATKLAKDNGIDEKGYRLVMNCNQDGGQSVFHIHMHLLGQRALSWPPG